MQLFDLTLPSPEENLALDEALLDEAEEAAQPLECLRLWEAPRPLVVVGRNSRVAEEVDAQACLDDGVPILRRTSGGCAIVAGPGSLMYAVVLSYELRPQLKMLDAAHRFVLETIAGELRPLLPDVARRGTSDLAQGELKFSGNSLRCRRRAFVYHGTLLYDFPLELIGRYLRTPPREPDYRAGRPHAAFVANLPTSAAALKAALITAWQAKSGPRNWPRERVRQAVLERYSSPDWNESR